MQSPPDRSPTTIPIEPAAIPSRAAQSPPAGYSTMASLPAIGSQSTLPASHHCRDPDPACLPHHYLIVRNVTYLLPAVVYNARI
jgi:hypothetical protein